MFFSNDLFFIAFGEFDRRDRRIPHISRLDKSGLSGHSDDVVLIRVKALNDVRTGPETTQVLPPLWRRYSRLVRPFATRSDGRPSD